MMRTCASRWTRRSAAPLRLVVGFRKMLKQSLPTKMFAGLACVTGGVGTVAFLAMLFTGFWISLQSLDQLPAFVVGILSYGLAYSVVALSTGIAIIKRYRYAFPLVLAVSLWSFANHAIWSHLYNMPLTAFSPRLALAVLFLVWMIFRRHELLGEETQPENRGDA